MGKYINNWKPEVKSLLKALMAEGVILVSGDNGEETFKFDGNTNKFIENLIACDEAHLYVRTPSLPTKDRWIYLVLGNDPGELVCDHTVDDAIDKATDAHYKKWEGRKQPKKLCPHFAKEVKRISEACAKLNDNLTTGKLGVIYYGWANQKPVLMPVIRGAVFYTTDDQLWYGIPGATVKTEVNLYWLIDSNSNQLFKR